MKSLKSRAFWGVLLILAGGVLMLEALGVLADAGLLWSLMFGAAGIAFLYVFFQDRESWWAAIPGFTLLGLAAASAWPYLGLGYEEWGGALFLGGMGIGFLSVYLSSKEHWWAIIPGGVMLTLALVAGLSTSLADTVTAGMLFLGFAVTFGVLAIVPTPEGRMRWPIIPAAVLVLIGALITLEATTVLDFIWPVALISGGLYLIFRTFGPGSGTGHHA